MADSCSSVNEDGVGWAEGERRRSFGERGWAREKWEMYWRRRERRRGEV